MSSSVLLPAPLEPTNAVVRFSAMSSEMPAQHELLGVGVPEAQLAQHDVAREALCAARLFVVHAADRELVDDVRDDVEPRPAGSRGGEVGGDAVHGRQRAEGRGGEHAQHRERLGGSARGEQDHGDAHDGDHEADLEQVPRRIGEDAHDPRRPGALHPRRAGTRR